jgi:hypothetical protein
VSLQFGMFPPVSDDIEKNGLTINQLWGAAWILGLGVVGVVVRLATYAAEGVGMRTHLLVWAVVGIVAAIFSACSAVMAAIKSAEQRMSQGPGASAP